MCKTMGLPRVSTWFRPGKRGAPEVEHATLGVDRLIDELFFCNVFATGVINDPVEFAIFAYVDTWAGWVGGVGMMTFLSLAHM